MMRRALCWLVLASATVMFVGCSSSPLEEGMPSDLDKSKISDPWRA